MQQRIQQQRLEQEQQLQKQQQMLLQQQMLIQQQQEQQAHLLKMKHQNYKKHQIHQHQALLAASISPKHTQQIATPPSTPSPPVVAQLPHNEPQKQVIITETNDDENELSVDDHFAKALGDTWRQLSQKENANK